MAQPPQTARGRSRPSARWRAEQSVSLREWWMPGHEFAGVLVTQANGLAHTRRAGPVLVYAVAATEGFSPVRANPSRYW